MSDNLDVVLDKIRANWNDDVRKMYPFVSDLFDYHNEFKVLCENVISNQKGKMKDVIANTTINMSSLAEEVLGSLVMGLRISMYSLNRSIAENLIVLSFIIKHGEPAAKIFVANGAVEFEKMRMKILATNPDFDTTTQTDRINIERTVRKIRDTYKTHRLGKEFMWANPFLNKGRNDRCRLEDLAIDVDMTEEYYNLSLLHQQTHSSSALSHYINIDTYDSYSFFASLVMMMVGWLNRCIEELPGLDKKSIKNFETKHDKIYSDYKSVFKHFSKK